MFPVPKYCLGPLKIWPFFCSPEINALFPMFIKPLGRPHMYLTDKPGPSAQQSTIHIVWSQGNKIEQKLNLWIQGPFK